MPKAVPVFAVRENGSNIKSAICGSAYYDISCFAHTLQLAIRDAIDTCDGMKKMLSKCRKIVGYYNHSSDATRKLEAKMARLGGEAKSLAVLSNSLEQRLLNGRQTNTMQRCYLRRISRISSY